MAVSDDARTNALQLEVKKDGLSQMQSGAWVLKLKVHPNDMPVSLMSAAMGTRYIACLVEVDDNEEPVQQEKPEKAKGGRLSQRAGILCGEPLFQKFMGKFMGASIDEDEGASMSDTEIAAGLVRLHCGVESRSELDHDPAASKRFEALLGDYEMWKRG